jgi:hypothetical protein
MKDKITLVVSDRMDTNKKESRNENGLIRIGAKARRALGLDQETHVELWPDGSVDDRINRSKDLKIFHAYKDEIKKLRRDGWDEDDIQRVAFVTSTTFKALCGRDDIDEYAGAWISDTVEETVVGADPEFVLVNEDDKVQNAGHILNHGGELGCDGAMAEIRPKPAIEVDDFVENIRRIFSNHPDIEHIRPYKWIGCCVYDGFTYNDHHEEDRPINLSVGGHLHFGTPAKLSGLLEEFMNKSHNLRRNYGYFLFGTLNKILDELVAVPMVKVEGKEPTISRRGRYGKYGTYRTEHGRLEYRTPGGEWLTHPALARMFIGSAKAVTHAFFQAMDEADYDESLIIPPEFKDDLYNDQIRAMIYSPADENDVWKRIELAKQFGAIADNDVMLNRLHNAEISFNAQYLNKWRSRLRNLPTYGEYADYIDGFVDLISLPRVELDKRDRELKSTWLEGAEFII